MLTARLAVERPPQGSTALENDSLFRGTGRLQVATKAGDHHLIGTDPDRIDPIKTTLNTTGRNLPCLVCSSLPY